MQASTQQHAINQATKLLNQHACGTPEFGRACNLLQDAASQGSAEACVMLGHVFIRNGSLENASAQAHDYFQQAHRAGLAEATERLADLYLSGQFGDCDTQSRALYSELAKRGDARSQCLLAYTMFAELGGEADFAQATRLYLRAAMQGYTAAFHLAGLCLLEGWGCKSDLVNGYAWLLLSAARRFPVADRVIEHYAADLSERERAQAANHAEMLKAAIRDLGQTIAALQSRNESDQVRAFSDAVDAQLDRTLTVSAIDAGPTQELAPDPELVCHSPRVQVVRGLASELDIAHLLDAALPELRPAEDRTMQRKGTEIDAFNGDAAMFSPSFTTPVMRLMQRRFASITQTSVGQFEPMSVLRYGQGHEYSLHVDYFDKERIKAHEQIGDLGGQRNVTCLIYLNTPHAGGQTHYPKANLKVEGHPGMGIIHYNVDSSGNADPASFHAGMPISSGEKWLARTAIRAHPLY